jgi:hypothetical protein
LLHAVALALVAPAAAGAQALRGSDSTNAPANAGTSSSRDARHLPTPSPWLPRLRLDNDAYNFWIHPGHRTDEEYTNGVVASLETLRGSFWGKRLGGGAPDCGADTARSGRCLTTLLSIGQDIWTPHLSRPPFHRPDWEEERPYAAWLYVSATGRSLSYRSMRALEVTLGVTGRPALGQLSQQIAHRINQKYTTRATGWETQVGFQPGVQFAYHHALLAARGRIGSKAFVDLAPAASIAAGTVRTSAGAGARLRLGYNISHPWDARAWRRRSPLEYWVSAGARAEYVARDFSLDGSLFDEGRQVTRVPGTHEYSFGAGLRMHRVLLQWEAITRSRQYETGPAHFAFSTMSASWEFFR